MEKSRQLKLSKKDQEWIKESIETQDAIQKTIEELSYSRYQRDRKMWDRIRKDIFPDINQNMSVKLINGVVKIEII